MNAIADDAKFGRIGLKIEGLSVKREVVLAESALDAAVYFVRNIPAFVNGVAVGDKVKLLSVDTGEFVVLERSGFVTIRVFVSGSLDRSEVAEVIESVVSVGGVFEVGTNKSEAEGTSLLMVSMKVDIGFEKIESIMAPCATEGCVWEYGNVYDDNGAALNWWA